MSPGVSSKPEDSDPVYTLNCEEPDLLPFSGKLFIASAAAKLEFHRARIL